MKAILRRIARTAAGQSGRCACGFVMLVLAAASFAQSLEEQLEAIANEVGGVEAEAPSQADIGDLERALLDADKSFAPAFDVEALAVNAAVPKRIGGGKVAGRLLRLSESRSKSLSASAIRPRASAFRSRGDLASVRLFAEDEGDAARLRLEVERRGGEVDAAFENVVLARLPVNDIGSFAEVDALYFMDVSPTYHPSASAGYGGRVSEGVRITKVDALQQAGVTGKGVKVGILDFGFQRYSALVQAGEVPRAAAQRAFNKAGRVEADTVHGTGCAEIIADMVPDAELYLAAVNGQDGQIIAAGRWLASQGVDIINFSGGGHYGPHNGSALLDRFVDSMVREHRVLWVNAAGNEGASHWTGMAVDRNRNGLVDSVNSRFPDFIAMSGQQFSVLVVWDDWGSDPRRPVVPPRHRRLPACQNARGWCPWLHHGKSKRAGCAGRDDGGSGSSPRASAVLGAATEERQPPGAHPCVRARRANGSPGAGSQCGHSGHCPQALCPLRRWMRERTALRTSAPAGQRTTGA